MIQVGFKIQLTNERIQFGFSRVFVSKQVAIDRGLFVF